MTRQLTVILVATLASLALAGCARKAAPTAPQGAFYPRTYPEILFPAGAQDPGANGAGAVIDDTNPQGPTAKLPENRSLFDSLKHPEAGAAK